MSQRLYFIFRPPAFEIELKTEQKAKKKESNLTARSRQSRGDEENLAANSTRFEKPKHHGEILAISVRPPSRRDSETRDLGHLSEMADISPRSRRDLESHKHHGEISAKSLPSRRDLGENFACESFKFCVQFTF